MLGLVVSAVFVAQAVNAATYQGPTQAAPGGNIPFTIWNRTASNAVQSNAAIAIDGGGPAPTGATGIAIGLDAAFNSPLDLGAASGGDNVYYGAARYASMNTNDALLKLETYDVGTDQFTTRFRVDKDGRVKSFGCFGATFVGATPANHHGSLGVVGSYYNADDRCATAFPASTSQSAAHVCRPEEILESIRCSVAGDLIKTSGGLNAWIVGGPPGFTAQSNDCVGWTNNTSGAYGRVWQFNDTTGGSGTLTTCNAASGLKFACCR